MNSGIKNSDSTFMFYKKKTLERSIQCNRIKIQVILDPHFLKAAKLRVAHDYISKVALI